MLGMPHQLTIEIFQKVPSLVRSLWPRSFAPALPENIEFELVDASAAPPQVPDWRLDAVLLGRDSATRKAVCVVGVEVQLGKDPDKPWRWPAQILVQRDRHRLPVKLMVVCPRASTARWAAKPIKLDDDGWEYTPWVIQPKDFPRITDLELARQLPQLANLSSAAHPTDSAVKLALLEATRHIMRHGTKQDLEVHLDLLLSMRDPGPLRDELEAEMQSIVGYKFQSDIALAAEAEGRVKGEAEGRVKGEAEGRVKGEAEGRARGEAEGRVKGEAEGRARGEAEGRATGLAEAVLELLDSHDAVVDDAERKLIMECHDPATLKAWLVRAVSASSAAEVLAENGHTDAS